ncbi:MAG: nucleotidyltransferase substrate binding protein [Firmicutes bacterium]|nr:nucleotidyltransferase substrate binding protein [Bacillota bacterium]
MSDHDVRWIQRLSHFRRALHRLREADALAAARPLSPLEQQGMIKAFEFCYELAWNLLKDYLQAEGIGNLYGSRSAIRAAFKFGLIERGELWMRMVDDRNFSSYAYDEVAATQLLAAIRADYLPLLEALEARMEALRAEEDFS